MAENFRRQSLRGNREGRAFTPGEIQIRMNQILRGTGGGDGWIPPQTTQKITPGGGNQNAFSPQAATVEDVTTPGRMAFANLMAGRDRSYRKQTGTGDRQGGYG
jgi:hypothetical protein